MCPNEALTKREEDGDFGIRGIHYIGADKGLAIIQISIVIQIHREEGHLGSDAFVVEPFVELDTVEYDHVIGKADVIELEVPVAVPYPVVSHPLSQKIIQLLLRTDEYIQS